MDTMHCLNDFQKNAKEAVEALANAHGAPVTLSVAGEHETYLTGNMLKPDMALWIYDDELEFKTDARHLLLERPDFDDLEEMLQYFLSELRKELENAQGAL